jgi:uncharacterized protein YicC (UPF0701 family)
MEECQELKNLQYRTLLTGNTPQSMDYTVPTDPSTVNSILQTSTESLPWSKLDKVNKLKKLNAFIDTEYKERHNLSKDEVAALKTYVKLNLDRKRLSKTRDVVYDKEEEVIKDIPNLQYRDGETIQHRFTLKAVDKINSTLKNMTPKKKKKLVVLEDVEA